MDDTISSDCSSCSSLDYSDLQEDFFYSESTVICNESLTDDQGEMGRQTSRRKDDQFGQLVSRERGYITQKPDIKFLVGPEQIPVYGTKDKLSSKSQVLRRRISSHENSIKKGNWRWKGKLIKVIRYLKRTSNVFLKNSQRTKDSYLTIHVPEFEPHTFRTVIKFIESGQISLDLSNVIGVLNVADGLGMVDLRDACFRYARDNIKVSHVMRLYVALQPYLHFHWTKQLAEEVNLYLNQYADKIYSQEDFENIPEKLLADLLSRKGACVSEEMKRNALWRCSGRRSCGYPRVTNNLSHSSFDINKLDMSLLNVLDQSNPSLCTNCECPEISSSKISSRTKDSCYISTRGSLSKKKSLESIGSDSLRSIDNGYISCRETLLL